ncbi:hypothetical protein N9B82_04805, partial [Saprospiraceae bacterium]|nr:hypothetical protein [Saprospiraceae bacterium]
LEGNDNFLKTFKDLDIHDYQGLKSYVHALPYGRNADKEDVLCVLRDGKGTCSTKHALLANVAEEKGITAIKLMLVMYKMKESNTKGVGAVLNKYNLEYIPEAHNYLREKGVVSDITFPGVYNSSLSADDIFEEKEIESYQIAGYKVAYHQVFMRTWLLNNPQIPYTFQELWSIREECIQALAQS